MKSPAPSHPWLFFGLIFGLSAPFWILSTQMKHSGLPDNLPVTDIGAALTPVIAAAMLRYREAGWRGVRELLSRTFDYHRVKHARWIVTAVLVMPLLYLVTYVAMRLLAFPVATSWHPSPTLVAIFALFFVAATAEELGYSAYETDTLQRHMSALRAAFVMGLFWALWHLPSMIVMGQPTALILWGLCATVAFRILSVWIYTNAGASAFVVILMHAVANTSRTGYPDGRSGYELGNGAVAYSVIILFTVIVVVVSRPFMLANFVGLRCMKGSCS